MDCGYQPPRSFVVQLSHPERLRFTIGDLEAVLAEFGYGDTRAERQLRLRLADARHRLRDVVPTRRARWCVSLGWGPRHRAPA